MTGIDRIAAERKRQIEVEGWSVAHDDHYTHGELADAAACYILPICRFGTEPPIFWPWRGKDWKPRSRIRDLERAGALIAAEIERLERAEAGS